MIIDANNLIAGRLGTVAAKRALLGEEVFIVNSEKAVITGSKKIILGKYADQSKRGEPFHGPFLPKTPDRFLKRLIRGMLPYKQFKGLSAFKRIKCYSGVPEGFKDKKLETIEKANVLKMQNLKYISVGMLCKLLKQR
ncbi:MAG: 50S ribosomal protein L13 [Candidatus Woesearchaeota archaeon]